MPCLLALLLSLATTSTSPTPTEGPDLDQVFRIEASMGGGALDEGDRSSFSVRIELDQGWFPAVAKFEPLLQILPSDSVKLSGRMLTEYKELSQNEFIVEPFERLIKGNSEEVAFTLKDAPAMDEAIQFSVLAYLTKEDTKDSWFVRRRFRLPLKAGAVASEVDAKDSHWGRESLYQIGDEIEPFELPRADGSLYALDEVLYEKNIIVTTYRAYW